ncbi:18452_t:CDS:2, partial [Acaulospora morrowiae]
DNLQCKRSIPITLDGFLGCGFLQYSVSQFERCEKTNRLRLQNYMQLKERMRRNAIKKKIGDNSLHIGNRGTYGIITEKNYKLFNGEKKRKRVENPNTYFEFGVPVSHRSLKKIENVKEDTERTVNDEMRACLEVNKDLTNGVKIKDLIIKYHKRIPSWSRSLMSIALMEKYLNQKEPVEYTSKFQPANFNVTAKMRAWVNENLKAKPERPRSMLLIGETRKGKTKWARSLGKHIYWNGNHNLDKWKKEAEYIVMDDFTWVHKKNFKYNSDYIERWKPVIGCQEEFEMTDKYRHKQTCYEPKPCIILCSRDQDPWMDMDEDFKEYFDANVVVIDLGSRDIRKINSLSVNRSLECVSSVESDERRKRVKNG